MDDLGNWEGECWLMEYYDSGNLESLERVLEMRATAIKKGLIC